VKSKGLKKQDHHFSASRVETKPDAFKLETRHVSGLKPDAFKLQGQLTFDLYRQPRLDATAVHHSSRYFLLKSAVA
jgi:hypothetical protein